MLLNRIKTFLLIALVITNISLGISCYSLLQRANSGYGQLIDRSIPIMSDLHEITLTVMRSYRIASQALRTNDSNEQQRLLIEAKALEHKSALVREHFQAAPDLVNGEAIDTQVEMVAKIYHMNLEQYGSLVDAGKLAEAERYRTDVLRSSADDYFETLEKRVADVEKIAGRLRSEIAKSQTHWGRVGLAVGGWPLWAGFLGLIATAIMMIALLVSVFFPHFGKTQAS